MNLPNLIRHPLARKIIACILAAHTWYILRQNIEQTATITAPVYVYNIPDDHQVDTAETVQLIVKSTIDQLRALDSTTIAVHVNAQDMIADSGYASLHNAHFLLPKQLTLLHCTPGCIPLSLSANKGHHENPHVS